MLLVRRIAPQGGFFSSPTRASGVFGVVGSGFAVLLAFVIFTAFQSYNLAKQSAGVEAVAVRQLYRTASLFSPGDQAVLHGQLICYGRAVAHDEWRTMRVGNESSIVNEWLDRIELTTRSVDIAGPRQDIAYSHWLDQGALRREGRRGRLAEAAPFVPPVVWVVLVLSGSLVIAFMWCFADPEETIGVQALMMVAVVSMVVSGLLVVRFLDLPYTDSSGSVQPIAMQQTLGEIEIEIEREQALTVSPIVPCDSGGAPAL